MRLLLDTHVVIWAFDDPSLLSSDPREALRRRPPMLVSVASLWEIAIKSARGRLRVPEDFPSRILDAGIELLPVTANHAWSVRGGPAGLATADPFDRLILAQAMIEGLTLATRDRALLASGIDVLKA